MPDDTPLVVPTFNRSWRIDCVVKPVNRRKVDEMIKSHYIGKWPTNLLLVYGLYRKNKVLGVSTWSEPHKVITEVYGKNTLELSRLWIFDEVPRNAESFLIGRSIRHIRRNLPTITTLVTFADPEYGHKGTIYKAANWTEVDHPSKHFFTYNIYDRTERA